MGNFRTLALATAAVVGVSMFGVQTAQARDWYILNFGTGTCMAAETVDALTPTPEQFHLSLRNTGITDVTNVTKNANGDVAMVMINWDKHGTQVSVMWFLDTVVCERVRQALIAKGALSNSDDLK